MIKKFLLYIPITALVLVGFYFIFTTSPHVRYWVDDFCSAAFLRDNGFVGAQIGWWRSWTGRYSAVFFTDIFELIGPWVVGVLPILLLTLLIISARKIFFRNTIFASLFVMLVLINSPNIIQSFYWQTGSLNYTIPFIFMNFFLGILISKKKKLSIPLSFFLMFVAGGFSEAFALSAAVLLIFVILALFLINPKDKKMYLLVAAAGLLGILVSLVVMSLAPGNAARGLSVTKPESLVFVIKSTLLGTRWFLLRMLTVKSFLFSLVLIFLAVFTFGEKLKVTSKKSLLLIILIVLSMIFTTMAVVGSGFYSMSIIPPERALFVVTSMLLLEFYAISVILNTIIRNTVKGSVIKTMTIGVVMLSFIFCGVLIKSTYEHWNLVRGEIAASASAWDKEVVNLSEIHNIKPVGGLDSFTDNKGWVASCVAGYYRLNGLQITD